MNTKAYGWELTQKKKKRISEDVNTTARLQKHNNTLSYYNLTNVSIEYLFRFWQQRNQKFQL